jgi:hypothetical protein
VLISATFREIMDAMWLFNDKFADQIRAEIRQSGKLRRDRHVRSKGD